MKNKTHEIKILAQYTDAVVLMGKTFEVRKNDRNYKKGDYLLMTGINESGYPTNEKIGAKIEYILHGGQFGIEKDYCVMAIVVDQQNMHAGKDNFYLDISDPNVYREREY